MLARHAASEPSLVRPKPDAIGFTAGSFKLACNIRQSSEAAHHGRAANRLEKSDAARAMPLGVISRGYYDCGARAGYCPPKGLLLTYSPKTIDTSHVTLTLDLKELVEKLAENNHDHWARKRIDEGWRYGESRNDTERTHPDLVPYEQLENSEKEYDRKTVVEVLKAIISLGYQITKVR
jgi:RyR domain